MIKIRFIIVLMEIKSKWGIEKEKQLRYLIILKI